VSDYSLEDRASGIRSPAEPKNFSCSSVSRPALWPTQSHVHIPGVTRGRGVTLTTHGHLVPRSRTSRSYTSSSPHVGCGTALLYFTYRGRIDSDVGFSLNVNYDAAGLERNRCLKTFRIKYKAGFTLNWYQFFSFEFYNSFVILTFPY
jgi:hypothetical protein